VVLLTAVRAKVSVVSEVGTAIGANVEFVMSRHGGSSSRWQAGAKAQK